MRIPERFIKTIFITAVICFLFVANKAGAVNFRDTMDFNVDKNFDASARTQITATLIKTTPKLYFYIEKNWWDSQVSTKQNEVLANLDSLSVEFESKIYPKLTSVFGAEWKPGVDGDERITILFEAMSANEGGYFREADEYIKLQLPDSNEREMLYLSLDRFDNSQLKVILAHEFVHLITFNQKEKIFDVQEETWLNEARADYSSTILGYDDKYDGSNLQRRVKDFIENPLDSVVEWNGNKYDYASVSLFTNYLVDHYSVGILTDSLKSKYIGIESLNYALQKNQLEDRFSQIFTNWTIASVLNDCSLGYKYCYLSQNLKNFKIAPSINFLPLTGNVSLSVTNVTKNWQPSWLKFIGGDGNLALDFSSLTGLNFVLPYIVEDSSGSRKIEYLFLGKDQKGEISIKNFGKDYKSIIIIPSLQSKTSDFDGLELTYPFTYSVVVTGSVPVEDQALIQKLLDQIAYLRAEIAKLIEQKNGGTSTDQDYCLQINNNLSLGMQNNNEVKCLQNFLKLQGQSIYPEGYITGNFGNMTKTAVIKFQEKYASEILIPIGLSQGTGYVGSITRQKINQLLNTR